MTDPQTILLSLALVCATGLIVSRISAWIRMPDVVIFLLIGLLAGAFGWLPFSAAGPVGVAITIVAASYILYQGGEGVDFAILRTVWLTVILLATLGVVITMAIVGWGAAVSLGVPMTVGLLVGAVLSATDPAVLIPIYQALDIRARLSQTVMSEAALNDATGAVCAAVVAMVVTTGAFSAGGALMSFGELVAIGALVGLATGIGCLLFIAGSRSAVAKRAGVLMLPASILAYLVAVHLGGSGLMAAFVLGLVIGHRARRFGVAEDTRSKMREYGDSTSVILRALLFIGLGANLDWRALDGRWLGAIVVVAILVFIARPLAVLMCTAVDRAAHWEWREIALLSWTRETGVVPGALATLLLATHVPGADTVAAVTVLAVAVTVLLQAPTTGLVARRLGLVPVRAVTG